MKYPISKEKLVKLKWDLEMAMDGEFGGVVNYRCELLKCSKTIHTPKKRGVYGDAVVSYHIDGDDAEYASMAALMAKLRELGRIE